MKPCEATRKEKVELIAFITVTMIQMQVRSSVPYLLNILRKIPPTCCVENFLDFSCVDLFAASCIRKLGSCL